MIKYILFNFRKSLLLIFFLVLFFVNQSFSQQTSDIKGFIKDDKSGEALPYANVIVEGTNRGTTTNTDGYFILVNEPVGQLKILVRYIGYTTITIDVDNKVGGIAALTVKLKPAVLKVDGVTVTATADMMNAAGQVSQVTISPRQIASLPNIGEVDIFRSLQLLPGISGVSDGSSGLYVRGGTPDQNLILFDGMTIYHVDHFFGFFSAFNADAIKDIQIMKGGFPAQYGGRISSVVNLTGKTGDRNNKRLGFGANLLSAHTAFEMPFSDKGTFLFAARRSYTDFIRSHLYDSIYELMTGEENGGAVGAPVSPRGRRGGRGGNVQEAEFRPTFYFYDLNSKLTLNPTSKDVFMFSFYNGRDALDKSQDYSGFGGGFTGQDNSSTATLQTTDYTKWGNLGMSGKWSRQWYSRLHTDFLAAYSKYFSQYDRNRNLSNFYIPQNDSVANRRGFAFASKEDNTVKDFTLRIDTDWFLTRSHTLKFGTWISKFDSRYLATLNDTTETLNRENSALQSSFYLQDKWRIKFLDLTFGLRASQYEPTGKLYYEPRSSFSLGLFKGIVLKGAWGNYYQFVNRIANENVTEGSRDFWLLADDVLKPAFAEHQIFGLSYENTNYYLSVEGYRKDMDNLIEFSRRFQRGANFGNRFFFGTGVAEGLEFLVQKKRGRLTGWVGYTLGRVDHIFPAFNDGDPFPADHDRKHEINVVAQMNIGVWNFAATWVFASGKAYTAPESQYFIDMLDGQPFSYIHVSDKNANRLPDYQRLDLSASRKFESDHWSTEVGISVFNAYNYKNVWYREYNLDTYPITVADAVMLGLTPTFYVQVNLR